MKATKLIALAVILGIASLGYAQTESPADQAPGQSGQSIVIPLKKAMQSPDLVKAMYLQLNPGFLKSEKPLYTVPVRYNNSTLWISGSYEAWKAFFHADPDDGYDVARYNLIPLPNAMRDPNLVKAMRAQLDPSLLQGDKEVYIAKVNYRHSVVHVSGTYAQWKQFFSIRPKADPLR